MNTCTKEAKNVIKKYMKTQTSKTQQKYTLETTKPQQMCTYKVKGLGKVHVSSGIEKTLSVDFMVLICLWEQLLTFAPVLSSPLGPDQRPWWKLQVFRVHGWDLPKSTRHGLNRLMLTSVLNKQTKKRRGFTPDTEGKKQQKTISSSYHSHICAQFYSICTCVCNWNINNSSGDSTLNVLFTFFFSTLQRKALS